MGPLVYAAMGEPESLEYIQQNPEESVTLERAELWDFAHPTDLNITLAGLDTVWRNGFLDA